MGSIVEEALVIGGNMNIMDVLTESGFGALLTGPLTQKAVQEGSV